MNIWIVNHYADAPDRQSTRTYDLARKLVERGHRVTIFAAGFSHYSFKEERVPANENWVTEDCNGVRFIWLRTFPYQKNDWRRMLNMASFCWRTFWVACKLRDKPDVVSGVSVHPFAALTGWFLAVIMGSRLFVEITDLWPEVLIDFGMLSRRSPITWMLRSLEKFLYRRAERILMIWPRTEGYVQRLGISTEKVVWLPHVAELSRYAALGPYDGIVRERFTIMYLGSFVSFMDMKNILRAAKVLQDKGRDEIQFVLVGGGTDKQELEELAAELKLRNVEFRGLVPKKDLVKVMSSADAYIVSLRDVPLLRYGISLNKACDYLASGRPTVFAGNPGYDPIKEAMAGISVPPNDPAALAAAAEQLMAITPQERVQMGCNGREYVARVHGLDVVADRLEAVLLGSYQREPGPSESSVVSKAQATIA
jgi:glycosyltransferase involved in cell wall biosynthesis